ncbi:MAG: hypothetical protein ABI147_11195 [Acidobacteriaceae bacterium]
MIAFVQKQPSLALQELPLLRSLPIALAALMMQQVARAEVMFPSEKRELETTLAFLTPPRSAAMERAVQGFAALKVPAQIRQLNWESDAAGFVEKLTAALWSTGQIDAFREAAKLLILAQPSDKPENATKTQRVVIVVLDKRLESAGTAPVLFRRLRAHGTFFPMVHSGCGMEYLRSWVAARASADPEPYAHWEISGDAFQETTHAQVVSLSFYGLQAARRHLLTLFNTARNSAITGGPEGLRRSMLYLKPEDIGLAAQDDPVLRSFATDVLINGSGTQLYSTTFVQWTVREALRRAQPRTLLACFAPRSQFASMDARLSHPDVEPPPDNSGSLVDAEMGSYLTYINLRRISGDTDALFLVWHEGYGQALLIGRDVPVGSQDTSRKRLEDLLADVWNGSIELSCEEEALT